MAGGKFAAEVACLQCLYDDRVVTRAQRIYEGDETDRYRCEKGHVFGMDWRAPATGPQWPPPAELLATTMKTHQELMRQAVELAHENRLRGGRPFGAVLAKDGEVIATGVNNIIASHDPSTHAEMEAIRAGTRKLANPSLAGCAIYASGHPCPMCLAALVMCGAEQVFFAFDNHDAAPYGLSSEGSYQRLRLSLTPPPLPIARIATGITAEQLYGDAPWPQP